MTLETQTVIAQIDDVLARCGVQPEGGEPYVEAFERREDAWLTSRSTACVALIDRVTDTNSSYRDAAQRKLNQGFSFDNPYTLTNLVGILLALRADVEAGYTRSLIELIHADVFADFLDMADELQSKGFKDAAAVIAGSTLEEHLRKLAPKHSIGVNKSTGMPKKADAINNELAGKEAYNKLEQKNVTAWLALRNNAAHGQYDEYNQQQVAALIQGVRDFMVRHVA